MSTSDSQVQPPSAHDVAAELLARKGLKLQSLQTVQKLWAGYGEICRVTAVPDGSLNANASQTTTTTTTPHAASHSSSEPQSFILKLVTPPATQPRDEGHVRKILSYRVEQYFYTHLAPQMPPWLPVPQCVGSIQRTAANGSSITATLLSDLRVLYPEAGESRTELSPAQVTAALDWLSGFHGFWWPRASKLRRSSLVLPPLQQQQQQQQHGARETSVWLNGGYTYLATRGAEFARLAHNPHAAWARPLTAPLSATLTPHTPSSSLSVAAAAAAYLAPRLSPADSPTARYHTLLHGDVKAANLFTHAAGAGHPAAAAFYDFQYTGLGLGACDLAKLFTCAVPLSLLTATHPVPDVLPMQPGERALLERYLARVRDASGQHYAWDVFARHWETALVDWLRFQASWGFWGNTEWLEARVRSILRDEGWRAEVAGAVGDGGFDELGGG
ncbi:hypothetical protein ACN47E_007194 [Coniothyrium glycines]